MLDPSSDLIKPSNGCPYVFNDELDLDAIQVVRYFQVLHLNVRSFLKNVDKLKLMLDECVQKNVIFDVILLCETFVSDLNVNFVNLPGYQCFNKNRSGRIGGGILVFVRDGITVKQVLDTPFNDVVESLFVLLEVDSKPMCVGELIEFRIPV